MVTWRAWRGRSGTAGEFSPETDVVDTPKENPYSHVAYGYGAQMITLNEKGEIDKVLAVYDVGTVMNEQSAVGQIEGGVMMGIGYGLTEEFVVEGGVPQTRYGKLGLMRADKMPEVEVRFVKGPGTLPYAYGAKGMGEICLIPTAPAAAWAYYKRDGKRRYSLPLRGTAYKKEEPNTFGGPQATFGAPASMAPNAPTEAVAKH